MIESFRAAGYRTTCLGKLHTWNSERDGDLGFDSILNEKSGEAWTEVHRRWRISREQPEFDATDAPLFGTMPFGERFRGRVRPDPGSCGSWLLTQEATQALRNTGSDPFFLYVGLRSPHYPFDLPRPWYHRFDPKEMPGAFGPPSSQSRGTQLQAHRRGWGRLSPEHHRLLQARYYAAVEYTDYLVGLVLDELEASGQADNTLVVYTSDHGDMAGERGCWLKHTMFDASARKPLLIRGAGLPTGNYDHLVSEVDVLPTIAALAGIPHPFEISGRDLSGALRSGSSGRETCFASDFINEKGEMAMTMARGKRFKLTRYTAPTWGDESVELFDMEQDPGEEQDLAPDPLYEPVVEELMSREQTWRTGLRAPRQEPKRLAKGGDSS